MDDLVPGMYVTQLDRPWLETPFLFQGFTIQSEAEISALKRYCRTVYVATGDEPGEAPRNGATLRSVSSPPRNATLLRRAVRWITGKREAGDLTDPRPDKLSLKDEIPRAKETHSEASTVVAELMDRVREGKRLDMEVLESTVNPMVESLLRNRDALTWLSRIRQIDDYTYGHCVSCSIYAIAFGRHLGLPKEDLKVLGLGGLLLDVGKTRIPKPLLSKKESLSDEEMALMRRHVEYGEEILKQTAGVDGRVVDMIRYHHERYDGSGYPAGLSGPDIPVNARIGGLVDFYDAVISPRVYASPVSAFDAMRALTRHAGREFQPEMVEQFIQAIGVFPNGALVELSTGEVGVVIAQNRVRRLRPQLMLILDQDKNVLPKPRKLDLRKLPSNPGEKGAVWIDRGLETGAYGINASDFYL